MTKNLQFKERSHIKSSHFPIILLLPSALQRHLIKFIILLSLLRTNTSFDHFENPSPIADDVTCERSLNNQTITKINRLRPFGKSDLILWLLHRICQWKYSAFLASFRIQTSDRFQTQQNAQETQ